MLTPVSSMYEIAIDFTVRTGTPTEMQRLFFFSARRPVFIMIDGRC